MAEVQSLSRAFPNQGLQLKQDPALLSEAHYSELTNVVSVQEGNLAVRAGSQKLSSANTFSGASAIHSISVLNVGSTGDEIVYVGEGTNLWYQVNGGSWNLGAATVATAGAYTRQRFAATAYSAGSSGLPYEYFACPSAMLKQSGSSPATGLQRWGILPPSYPAVVALGAIDLLPAGIDAIYSLATGATLTRIATGVTITGVSGTAPGSITITPSSMNQIDEGMLIRIGATPLLGVVQSANATSFTSYLTATPAVGDTLQSAQVKSSTVGSVTLTTVTVSPMDASFNGIASSGYSTDDIVHVSVYASDPSQYLDMRLRVLVNSSKSDYYEKSILPAAIQPQVSGTQTATQNISNIGANIPQNVLNQYPYINEEITRAKAEALAALSSATVATTNLVWSEISVPKSQFLSVGNAGSGPYSWKNVTGFQFVYKTVASPTGTLSTAISSLYIAGGYGPNAVTDISTYPRAPYKYLFTYRNPITGAQGNPSPEMISDNAVSPQNQAVNVIVQGSDDPQVSGSGSVAVYRSGGSFSDSYYRFVGYAVNPGGGGTVIFEDNQSDQSIDVNDLVDFDNDVPVSSALPTPLIMTSLTPALAGQATALAVTVNSGSLALLTVGTPVTVGINTENQETCIVSAVSSNTVTLFLQYDHSDAATNPITIQADYIAGQPCNLCLEAFDSIFLAGDPNNPQVLYRSKSGRPEAFPIINLTTNVAQAINVGTPANYIVNLTEYSGGVLCMNLNNLFYVAVASGIMEAPLNTPAQRGLLARNAWCKADNEVWYLSYDGIYSWAGGASTWRSQDIDPLFQGFTIGPYAPIDVRPHLGTAGADVITMEYSDNEIFVSYLDTAGSPHRLRYHTKFNRWSIDNVSDPIVTGAPVPITAQYNDRTRGILYSAKTVNSVACLYEENSGTSDGWVSSPSGGQAITFSFTPAAFTAGAPGKNKTFADVILEKKVAGSCTLQTFYDFLTTADESFTISGLTTRTRAVNSIQNGFHKEAYAFQGRVSGTSAVGATFYSLTLSLVPLTDIQVGKAYDWDDLGWPYDKKLYHLVMTYDVPPSEDVVMNLDTMTGITGAQTETRAVQTFTISPATLVAPVAPNRIQANFALNDNTVAKLVRLRPTVVATPFKHFSYQFPDFTKYPADIVLFTEWTDEGYPCEKTLRSLEIEINTGGVPCSVQVQGDGANLGPPISITTTANTRFQTITLPSNLTAKALRLVFTPGAGGMSQYFKHQFIYVKEPCAVTHWDSLETNFGYDGYNFIKQIWLQYQCLSSVVLSIYVDAEMLFYTTTLPAHAYRDIERFYLPASVARVLNKSRRKRMMLDSFDGTSPFRLYPDGSRVEWMPCGADQRSAYQQATISSLMSPGV